jgi:hypothetical protein
LAVELATPSTFPSARAARYRAFVLHMRRRERRPNRACGVVWLALGAVLLALGCGPPARAVAPGPPTSIALDVGFFLPVLGTWVVRGFTETLRDELAKYDIAVVDRRDSPASVAVITLGAWSDRVGGGRLIQIDMLGEGGLRRVGHELVADLSMTTLDVAAQDIAFIIARSIRGAPAAQPVARCEAAPSMTVR